MGIDYLMPVSKVRGQKNTSTCYSASLSATPTTEALKHYPRLMGSHRDTCHPHDLYIRARAEPHLAHLHSQFSTAVTNCLLVTTHFTDPERPVACESAAPGSCTHAAGVIG